MTHTGTMAAGTVRSTTGFRDAVGRHSERVKDALRWARSRAVGLVKDNPYVQSIAKAVLSGKQSKAVDHVTALLVDLAQRCESSEEAETVASHFVSIVRAEWAAAHPQSRCVRLSRPEAELLEEQCQGEHENAEKALDLFPSDSNRLRLIAASAKYRHAIQVRDEAVQRELVTEVLK